MRSIIYKWQKGLSYIKCPNTGLGAFLDILWTPVSHSRSTEPKMALKETVFIMFFILSPIGADLGGELQKEIDNIKQVINKQVLKALDDLSTKAGKCIGTRIVVITS